MALDGRLGPAPRYPHEPDQENGGRVVFEPDEGKVLAVLAVNGDTDMATVAAEPVPAAPVVPSN